MRRRGGNERPRGPARGTREEAETLYQIGRDASLEEALAPGPAPAPRRPRLDVEVLREGPGWAAVLKPAGLASVRERGDPGPGQRIPTALSRLHEAWRRRDPGAPRPFVIHRIDKETSGVLLFGRDPASAAALSRAFRRHQVGKEYLAIVEGRPEPPAGEVELRLQPDPRRSPAMRVVRHGGKPSTTAWETLETFREHALLAVRPRTGRTHQIRVTLAHLGWPVVADPLYGGGPGLFLSHLKHGYKPPAGHPERPLLGRLALHALRLGFDDPAGGSRVEVEAPIPKDFRVALERLRRHAPA